MTTSDNHELDARLLGGVGRGDSEAFAQLYDRFAPTLYSLVLRMVREEKEAEEILQEGFSHIWHRAATYTPAHGSALAWAVMVVRQEAVDRLCLRRRQARTQDEMSQADGFAKSDDVSGDESAMRKQRALVLSALAHVSEEQKQALELAFLSELTHEEIAAGLGTSLRAIKERVRSGLLRLGVATKEGR